MKQIKTIIKSSATPELFDEEVNAALAEGWTLTKREVLGHFEVSGVPYGRTLYAELEREVVTEAERCCENCAHFGISAAAEPCASCSEECDKWKPAEEIICE